MNTVTVGWPPAVLSPNRRAHWRQRAAAVRAYRDACFYLSRQAHLAAPESNRIRMRITFCPPDRRRRDDDNMIAAFKAGRDGIAMAIGVDDSRFELVIRVDRERIFGWVEVTLEAADD